MFFSLKRIHLLFKLIRWKKFWIWLNPQFSMARRKRENRHKSAPFCFTTEFWEDWIQRQLWQLPRNGRCFAASHFTVVAVLLVKNLQLKCIRGVVADLENGIALHSIQYFSDDRPQAKKKTKKVGVKQRERSGSLRRTRPSVQCTSSQKIFSLCSQVCLGKAHLISPV